LLQSSKLCNAGESGRPIFQKRNSIILDVITTTDHRYMASSNEHGRLIAAAAKAALLPLGCKRKGQSRLWHSDQRFWVISIEFQPSGWAKGSYLNVGVKWLWNEQAGITCHPGYRAADFVPFQSNEQFKPRIEEMAGLAAKRVLELRTQFRSLRDVHRWLVAHATREGWPIYEAAVAAALIGDYAGARQLFERIRRWPTDSYDWQIRLKSESARLERLLSTPGQFRSAILDLIEGQRALIGLPGDPDCLQQEDSTILRLPISSVHRESQDL
jgi:hypothetical protein